MFWKSYHLDGARITTILCGIKTTIYSPVLLKFGDNNCNKNTDFIFNKFSVWHRLDHLSSIILSSWFLV
jgi:hypothetical protein